jgi:hypothetical protein
MAVAIYFAFSSKKHRELVFSINPIRTRVVIAGQATDLKLLYRDRLLGDVDVTAVQLAIWNAGNESIKPEHIRKEIVVVTEPSVPILEATSRNLTAETGLSLLESTDSRSSGKVPLSWTILKKNDGASIQLLYLGKAEVDVRIEGLIEGQGHPKKIPASTRFKALREY